MAAALRRLGFDYVFDTSFQRGSYDHGGRQRISRPVLTALKEERHADVHILLSRLGALREDAVPGQLVPYLSSAKSPQQMFGAVSKTYFAKVLGVDPSPPVLRIHYALCGEKT